MPPERLLGALAAFRREERGWRLLRRITQRGTRPGSRPDPPSYSEAHLYTQRADGTYLGSLDRRFLEVVADVLIEIEAIALLRAQTGTEPPSAG